MSIASKEAVSSLQSEFNIKPNDQISCYANAFVAALKIFVLENIVPQVFHVEVPNLDDEHSYLVYRDQVYNTGITWPDATYPNIDLLTLQSQGKDVTSYLFCKALEASRGKEDDLNLLPILDGISEGNLQSLKPILVNAWLQVNNTTKEEVLNGSFSKTPDRG